jgi:hypothetical protein
MREGAQVDGLGSVAWGARFCRSGLGLSGQSGHVPELRSVWGEASDDRRVITSVDEYRGEAVIAIGATQLGSRYTRAQSERIVTQWVEFLSGGPSSVAELHFVSRTPKRLFAALRGQTQLQRLFVKWGDYDDLSSLQDMHSLRVLRLGGASSVRDLSPLSSLSRLSHLEIESIRHAHDLSPLASLVALRQLEFGGDWKGPRRAHIDSIGWLPRLQGLEHLLIHTLIVDDLDYSPVLRLPHLRAVRVMAARGMRPPIEELQRRLPWAG